MIEYPALTDSSRVWIYQSSRPFSPEEQSQLEAQLRQFTEQWVSHNRQLKAFGKLYHERFVVLMVDESMAGASGCSIDSSVKFIKALEGHYAVDFFDRMTFAYLQDDNVHTASKDQFAQLYAAGQIDDQTIVFDNLVKSKADFDTVWKKKLKDSWHKRFVH